ncbi:MAG: hypothetical protein ABEJ26_03585 [Halosimplex sp.]
MDRVRNAALNFGINFVVGYLLGRALRGKKAAARVGLALGSLGAVASWRLGQRFDADAVEPTSEPIEIEIEE